MQKISGSILSSIFATLAGIHIYWALGGRRGLDYVLPTQGEHKLLMPAPPVVWAVAVALFGAMATTLGRMQQSLFGLPRGLFRLGMRSISLIFLLRAIGDFRTVGFCKTITDTHFARWDTRLYSPLCLGIAALAAITEGAAAAALTANKPSK